MKALGRAPCLDEEKLFGGLIKSLIDDGTAETEIWRHVTHTVFNMQEFIHYR